MATSAVQPWSRSWGRSSVPCTRTAAFTGSATWPGGAAGRPCSVTAPLAATRTDSGGCCPPRGRITTSIASSLTGPSELVTVEVTLSSALRMPT
jgi:hypothetical protein